MAARTRFTKPALADLRGIADYIARDDPQAAARIVERIRLAVTRLVASPGMGRPGRIAGTRELVVAGTPFYLPYRVKDGVVDVLRVIHAARDWPGRENGARSGNDPGDGPSDAS